MATATEFSELQKNYNILQSSYDTLVQDNNNLRLQLQTSMEKLSELEAKFQSFCDFDGDFADDNMEDTNSAKRRKPTTKTTIKPNVNSKSSDHDKNSCLNGTTVDSNASSFGKNINSTFAQIVAGENSSNLNSNINSERLVKPMPLQLEKLNSTKVNDIVAALNQNFAGKFEFVFLKSGSSPRIYAADSETKQHIVSLLKQHNIEFNTFADKNTKQMSFILRGLNFGDDTLNFSSITAALGQIGVTSTSITSVSRYFTPFMKRNYNDEQYKLYRFTLKANTNISNLNQIKSIAGFRISIEKMRKSTIIQCHRCQRFQHTAGSCSFHFRCVQCVTTHAPGQCPRKSNNGLPIQCCNCTTAGISNNNHTANNLNACGFFKTKHSNLFNKFQQISSSEMSGTKNTKSVSSNNAVAQPLIEPTLAKNGNASSKSKNNKTDVINRYRPSVNASKHVKSSVKSSNLSTKNVNSGRSHTDTCSEEKINALTCALVQLLRQFL